MKEESTVEISDETSNYDSEARLEKKRVQDLARSHNEEEETEAELLKEYEDEFVEGFVKICNLEVQGDTDLEDGGNEEDNEEVEEAILKVSFDKAENDMVVESSS